MATPGQHGKLMPGEKQRLKRAKVDAKRAARAVAKGFDAAAIVSQLEAFVLAEGDMKVRACSLFRKISQDAAVNIEFRVYTAPRKALLWLHLDCLKWELRLGEIDGTAAWLLLRDSKGSKC